MKPPDEAADALAERFLAAAGTYIAAIEAQLPVLADLLRAGRSACDELRTKILETGDRQERKKLQRFLDETRQDADTLDRQLGDLRAAIAFIRGGEQTHPGAH